MRLADRAIRRVGVPYLAAPRLRKPVQFGFESTVDFAVLRQCILSLKLPTKSGTKLDRRGATAAPSSRRARVPLDCSATQQLVRSMRGNADQLIGYGVGMYGPRGLRRRSIWRHSRRRRKLHELHVVV